MQSSAEVSANGCATGFGGTLADVIERLLVSVRRGRDQGNEVGTLTETECDHALAPVEQPAGILDSFRHRRRPGVPDRLRATFGQHQVATPAVTSSRQLSQFVRCVHARFLL